MIHRLPKKHKEKYKKERSWDEELIYFAFKVVGSTVLMFVVSAGLDVYHLMH